VKQHKCHTRNARMTDAERAGLPKHFSGNVDGNAILLNPSHAGASGHSGRCALKCHICGGTPAEGHDYRRGVKPLCTHCFQRIVATQGTFGAQKCS